MNNESFKVYMINVDVPIGFPHKPRKAKIWECLYLIEHGARNVYIVVDPNNFALVGRKLFVGKNPKRTAPGEKALKDVRKNAPWIEVIQEDFNFEQTRHLREWQRPHWAVKNYRPEDV